MLKPGRDPSKTIQALAEFKKVIADYPASDQAKPAQERVRECEERLAAHNADIAISYHNRRAYRASISRLTEVMSTYPEYSRLDRIYFYLGDCFFWLRADCFAKHLLGQASKSVDLIELARETPQVGSKRPSAAAAGRGGRGQ